MDDYDRYAARFHRYCPVVDAHLDLVTALYRNYRAGKMGALKNYYLEELRKGGVNLVFASLFLGESELRECAEEGGDIGKAALKKSLEMLAVFLKEMELAGAEAVLVKDQESLAKALRAKKESPKWSVGILLYLEGLDMLDGEVELLRCFYEMGVRGAALTWNRRKEMENPFAAGCGSQGQEGLEMKPKGAAAISLMEELGMFVDSSHLSRQAADILPLYAKKPFAATHSNAAALAPHPRNLTDEQIKAIALRGGVIGVNAYREFVFGKETGLSGAAGLCGQIAYLLEKAGEDHVGLGLDFGEESCLSGYAQLPEVTARLLRMGYSEKTIKKVLGQNWIRYLNMI